MNEWHRNAHHISVQFTCDLVQCDLSPFIFNKLKSHHTTSKQCMHWIWKSPATRSHGSFVQYDPVQANALRLPPACVVLLTLHRHPPSWCTVFQCEPGLQSPACCIFSALFEKMHLKHLPLYVMETHQSCQILSVHQYVYVDIFIVFVYHYSKYLSLYMSTPMHLYLYVYFWICRLSIHTRHMSYVNVAS